MNEWRPAFIDEFIANRTDRMAEIFNNADQSSYGIFDAHYLKFAILLRARKFDMAMREIMKVNSIEIADKTEQAEHREIASLLCMLINKYRDNGVEDDYIISKYRISEDSNYRFLWGFANGGYIGLNIVFPLFSQILTSRGTSFAFNEISKQDFKDLMINASRNNEPFSYIRYNDGEGCLLYELDRNRNETTNSFEHYLAISRLWKGWFGTDVLLEDPSLFMHLQEENEAVIAKSSVLGLDLNVVNHWGASKGLESKLGCYYSAFKVSQLRQLDWVVNSDILYQLQEDDGFVIKFLKSQSWSVISCHVEVKQRLESRGITIVDVLEVPAEQQFNSLFGTPSEPGRHLHVVYPDLSQMIEGIRVDRNRYWIVSAGPLGKIYAHKLKERGCFVLDLGAILDGILGYERRERLKCFTS